MMYALYDETKPISHVFMHKPGKECKIALEAEDPAMWLFDSSLKGVNADEWIAQAGEEFDGLVSLLQPQGIKVSLLTDLLETSLLKSELESALKKATALQLVSHESANDFWQSAKSYLVSAALEGVKLKFEDYSKLDEAGLSILIPKPNAYFSQDPFAIIADYFVELKHANWQRSGEPGLWKMALQPSPDKYVKLENIAEGGDITLVKNTALVGIGTRTSIEAAHELCSHVGKFGLDGGVVPVYKPDASLGEMGMNHSKNMPYIHLDTIFMPLDGGEFVGNIELMNSCTALSFNGFQPNISPLTHFLDSVSHGSSNIIPVSNDEQYSLAANVLPANGIIICAGANRITNKNLIDAGYKVAPFEAAALLGGCGSAHCMSNAANMIK